VRILLITPSFFGYEQSIADAFRAKGHQVDLVDERPSNEAWVRALVRVVPALLARRIRRHYEKLRTRLADVSYDALLVIKGEVVPSSFLDEFIERNQRAIRVYYTFDSFANNAKGARILDYFQHRLTFDRVDADADDSFGYKPLFYSPAYGTDGNTRRDLDISFVRTLHGDRYAFTQAVAAQTPAARRSLYYFIPAAWYFWLRELLSSEVRVVPRESVHTRSLAHDENANLMRRSKAVIDVQRPGQTGLTMRTFEALACGSALITANQHIRDEPFFDDSRVLVVPRNAVDIDAGAVRDFVARQPETASAPDGFEAYSLDAWTDEFIRLFDRTEPS